MDGRSVAGASDGRGADAELSVFVSSSLLAAGAGRDSGGGSALLGMGRSTTGAGSSTSESVAFGSGDAGATVSLAPASVTGSAVGTGDPKTSFHSNSSSVYSRIGRDDSWPCDKKPNNTRSARVV